MKEIPVPTVQRLCTLFQILKEMDVTHKNIISSSEIGSLLCTNAYTVRKDICCLGVTGNSGTGYEVKKLMDLIGNTFGFFYKKKACVVGLGRIGSALLCHSDFCNGEFDIVAGFDSNVNRIETIISSVPLFPAYQIKEIVNKMSIEYGLLAIPAGAAQEIAEKLAEGGIKGIINFASTVIKLKNRNVIIKNIDITGELRILSALNKIQNDFPKQFTVEAPNGTSV